METYSLKRHVGGDGILRIEHPVGVQDDVVEVVVVVQPASNKQSAMSRAKEKHERAYEPWTPEEEERLLKMHQAGAPTVAISRALKRQPSAIWSRLGQLTGKADKKNPNNP